MAYKINAHLPVLREIKPSRNHAVQKAEIDNSDCGQRGSAGDAAHLFASSTKLQRVEIRVREAHHIDRNRVDALRQRIGAGDFAVDAERLARKLMRLEQDLL